MNADRMPLPRFWYLPRGEKAVVVMSGDDHAPGQAPGGTASNFDRFKALSPAGCSVVEWECVRASSYIYPDSPLTNAQAAAYVAEGFEVGLHPVIASCPTTTMTAAQLSTYFDTQLSAFAARYTSIPAPVSSRSHCVYWPDWSSNAEVELAHGIRLDANYYHYPGPWLGALPGFLNGGGFPMRFAKLDGTPIDVFQQNTNMADEAGQNMPTTVAALLDNAVGPLGLLRRVRREHAHRQSGAASGRRGDRRRGAGARRAGDLVQADARLGRRPRQLDDPRAELERRHALVRRSPSAPAPTGCRRWSRCRARPGR